MGSPSRNVQYHPPRLSEDRLNLPQPHSPSLPTHCSGKSGMRPRRTPPLLCAGGAGTIPACARKSPSRRLGASLAHTRRMAATGQRRGHRRRELLLPKTMADRETGPADLCFPRNGHPSTRRPLLPAGGPSTLARGHRPPTVRAPLHSVRSASGGPGLRRLPHLACTGVHAQSLPSAPSSWKPG